MVLLLDKQTGKMMEEEDEDILFDQADIEGGDDRTALLSDRSFHVQTLPESHKTVQSGPSKCFKVFSTICLCAAFLGLGLCIAIPGPTLIDLQQQTNTDTETISRLFTGRSVGYLGGSIFGGVLYDRINQPCLLSFSILLTAAATAVAPWCSKFMELVVVFGFQGMSMGFLDTGGNVMCVQTWGEGNGPWMQALHFSFGIGAFVAPLIAEPFLSRNMTHTIFVNESYSDVDNFTLPNLQDNGDNGKGRSVRDVRYFDDGDRATFEDKLELEKRSIQKRYQTNDIYSKSNKKKQKFGKQNQKNSWWLNLNMKNPLKALGITDAITNKFIEALQKLGHKPVAAPAPKEGKQITVKPTTEKPPVVTDKRPKKRPRPNNKGFIPNNFIPGKESRKKTTVSQITPDITTRKITTENKPSTLAIDTGKSKVKTITPDERFNKSTTHIGAKSKASTINFETPVMSSLPITVTEKKKTAVRPRPKKGPFGWLPSNFGTNNEGKPAKARSREENSDKKVSGDTAKVEESEKKQVKNAKSDENTVLRKQKENGSGPKFPNSKPIAKGPTKSANYIPTTEEINQTVKTTKSKPKRPRPNNSRILPGGFMPGKAGGKEPRRGKRDVNSPKQSNATFVEGKEKESANNNSTVISEMNSTTTTIASPSKPKKPSVSGSHLSKDKKIAGSLVNKKLQNLKATIDKTTTTVQPLLSTTPSFPLYNNATNGTFGNGTYFNNSDAVSSSAIVSPSTVAFKSTKLTSTTAKTTLSTTKKPTTPSTTASTTPSPTTKITVKTTDSTKPNPSSTKQLTKTPTTTLETVQPSNDTIDSTTPKDDTGVSLTKIKNAVKFAVRNMDIIIHQLTLVQFAYLTIAIYLFVVGCMFMILCCNSKCTIRALKLSSSTQGKCAVKNESKGFKIQLLILLFCFFFLYVGMEITYGGLLLTFSVDRLHWSKSQGDFITAVFFGSFAAARGLTIFLAKCLSPSVILIVDLILTNGSLIAMLITIDSNPAMMWYCNVILGLGMAAIFPTGISWAEQYINLTGKDTASFVVGSAFGEMLLPAFTGFMFQQKGPMWLLYILTGCAMLNIVIYIIMQNLASNSARRYRKISSKLRDTTLTDLDHADLEMDRIPLTSDLNPDQEPLISDYNPRGEYYEQNGAAGKSRKKVTFNFSGKDTQKGTSVKSKVGSILKMKRNIKKD